MTGMFEYDKSIFAQPARVYIIYIILYIHFIMRILHFAGFEFMDWSNAHPSSKDEVL